MTTETDQSPRARDGVPAGYALVPLEPTPEMLVAFNKGQTANLMALMAGATDNPDPAAPYRAMLAAVPAAAPAALVPLTWEQFKKIVGELYGEPDDDSMDDISADDIESAMAVVRAVERAHGIQAPATAHTPGPWRIWTSNSFRRISSDATGKDGDVLHAVVHRSDGHPDLHFPNGGFDGPDARLIAAAPELLQALAAMVTAFAWGDMNDGEAAAIKEARTVLVKATGVQA